MLICWCVSLTDEYGTVSIISVVAPEMVLDGAGVWIAVLLNRDATFYDFGVSQANLLGQE